VADTASVAVTIGGTKQAVIPVRIIAESMGKDVTWNPSSKQPNAEINDRLAILECAD